MDCTYSTDTVVDSSNRQRSTSTLQLSDDIRTRSIEKTLLPLLSQINTLVSSRAGSQSPSTVQQVGLRPGIVAQQHAARVGLLVSAAADKFVAVGESLADEYPDAALEMREACNEVQTAALELRRLTDLSKQQNQNQTRGGSPSRNLTVSPGAPDSLAVVTTSRQLLSSITKVLLLADKLCVKQILAARDRVLYWLQELEQVSSRPTSALAEFVATFSELGRALVELAHLSGDRQADLRQEKDREALAVSRATLERGTQLLLAAAKTCLRHPESIAAARVRDSILRMMRQALNNVGQTLNDTISSTSGSSSQNTGTIVPQSDSDSSGATGDSGFPITATSRTDSGDSSLPLRELVSNVRSLVDGEAFSLGAGSAAIRRLDSEVNRLADALQDFTDCAYTPHASRERLLGLLDRLRAETNQIAEHAQSPENQLGAQNTEARAENVRLAVNRLADIVAFVQTECQRTAEQLATAALDNRATLPAKRQISQSTPDVSEATAVDDYTTLINQLEFVALSGDQTAFHCSSAAFEQRADLAIEAARLFRHVAPNQCLLMDAEHVLSWLRLIASALSSSAQVLFEQFPNPVSRVSRESFRSFANAWNDCVTRLFATLKDRFNTANALGNNKSFQSPGTTNSLNETTTMAGLFASPTCYSPPTMNPYLSSNFYSAESLCMSATPPNGQAIPGGGVNVSNNYRQSSLPRQMPRGLMSQNSPLNRSPGSFNTPSPQQNQQAIIRRSGSQPSLLDHLRQLRRHADNLSAMDGAVASFSTGNGPLNTTADLLLQAQFVAEQSRTICRLATTAACQLPTTHGLRDNVLAAVEKALAATGRLEAVLAMPPPVVPTAPYQSQQAAGVAIKNERVIASCHAAVVAASSVVNILLQSSIALPLQQQLQLQQQPESAPTLPMANPPFFSNTGSGGRNLLNDYRNYAAPTQFGINNNNSNGNDYAMIDPTRITSSAAMRGRRPWYSRSAANLAPNGAHPLSLGDNTTQQQQQLQSQRLV